MPGMRRRLSVCWCSGWRRPRFSSQLNPGRVADYAAGIYRNPAVAVAVVVTLLTSAALHAFVLFLPLYFQLALGVSATQAGTMLMPMLLGIMLGAILAGQLLSRIGSHYRMQTLAGTALMAGGMYLFSILGDGGGLAQSMPVLFSQVYLIIAALGFGAVVATLSVAVQNGVAVPARGECHGRAAVQPLAGRHGGSGGNRRGDVAELSHGRGRAGSRKRQGRSPGRAVQFDEGGPAGAGGSGGGAGVEGGGCRARQRESAGGGKPSALAQSCSDGSAEQCVHGAVGGGGGVFAGGVVAAGAGGQRRGFNWRVLIRLLSVFLLFVSKNLSSCRRLGHTKSFPSFSSPFLLL